MNRIIHVSMVEIYMSRPFYAEKKYIVKTLLNFLDDVEYMFFIGTENEFRFQISNGKSLVLNDDFFSHCSDYYLAKENIPQAPKIVRNIFTPEQDLPVLYGNEEFVVEKDTIYCGADIFASAFFFLTRWEESVSEKKDSFGRFPDSESFLQKNNLHYRPLVNEYIELLNRIFMYLGVQTGFDRVYTVKPTHDIDYLFRLDTIGKTLKSAAGDIVKRLSFRDFIKTTSGYFSSKINKKNDPYNCFDFMALQSEKHLLHATFYFIPSYIGEPEAQYDVRNPHLADIIHNLIDRGHKIGVHGSLSASRSSTTFINEKKRLEEIAGLVSESRMHYLRVRTPDTFRRFEEANILTDSSLSYSNDGGFRCGICFEFPVFDVENRKELSVTEMPLIVMETALRKKYPKIEDFLFHFKQLANIVKKYKGDFVFLWHNNRLDSGNWRDFKPRYNDLMQEII